MHGSAADVQTEYILDRHAKSEPMKAEANVIWGDNTEKSDYVYWEATAKCCMSIEPHTPHISKTEQKGGNLIVQRWQFNSTVTFCLKIYTGFIIFFELRDVQPGSDLVPTV